MKNTFLTGEVGVGKSTALRKYIEISGIRPAGIMTVFDSADENGTEKLYMLPWSVDREMALSDAISRGAAHAGSRNRHKHEHKHSYISEIHRTEDASHIPRNEKLPEVFNDLGVRLLRKAHEQVLDGEADIIVIDELGFMEAEAYEFRSEVMNLLDHTTVRILGVVKERPSQFTDAVKNHERTRLLTVTKENRNDIPTNINL